MSLDRRVAYALVGTAAVGAGVGLAYYLYQKEKQAESGVIELELKVEQVHITWLEGIASKYTDGDSVKALHMLVDHCKAASTDDEIAEIIFKKVRCNQCGKKEKVAFMAKLLAEHVAFIDSAVEKYEITGGQDKTLRVMFEYAINDVEEGTVFSN